MKITSVVSVVAAVVGLGALAYLATGPQSSKNNPEVSSKADQSQDDSSDFGRLREEVAGLKQILLTNTAQPAVKDPDVIQLKNEVALLHDKLEDLSDQLASTFGQARPERAAEKSLEGSPEERRAAADQRAKEIIVKLEGVLQKEDVDSSWVNDVQSKLQSVFRSDTLMGSSLSTSDCRTSLCRIEIAHGPGVDVAEFQSEFVSETAELFPQGTFEQITGSDGNKITVGYFAREGHNLPN